MHNSKKKLQQSDASSQEPQIRIRELEEKSLTHKLVLIKENMIFTTTKNVLQKKAVKVIDEHSKNNFCTK